MPAPSVAPTAYLSSIEQSLYESLAAWDPTTAGSWDPANAFDPVPPIAAVHFGPSTYHNAGFQLEVLSLVRNCYVACDANPACERFLIVKAARETQEAFGNFTCELYRSGESFTVDPNVYAPGVCAQAQVCDTDPIGLGPERCMCHSSCLTQDITDCCDDYISTCAMPNITRLVDASGGPGARSGGLLVDPRQAGATVEAAVGRQPAGAQAGIVVIAALSVVLAFVGAFAARRRSRAAQARAEAVVVLSSGGPYAHGLAGARPAVRTQTLFQDTA